VSKETAPKDMTVVIDESAKTLMVDAYGYGKKLVFREAIW